MSVRARQVRALIGRDQSSNCLRPNICLGPSKCSWHTSTSQTLWENACRTWPTTRGRETGWDTAYGCVSVSRTVAKQVIRYYSQYAVCQCVYVSVQMVDMVYLIGDTAASEHLFTWQQYDIILLMFRSESSKAWTVTKYWKDKHSCQWTHSELPCSSGSQRSTLPLTVCTCTHCVYLCVCSFFGMSSYYL